MYFDSGVVSALLRLNPDPSSRAFPDRYGSNNPLGVEVCGLCSVVCGLGVTGLGFGIWGSGFRVLGFGFWVSGLGFGFGVSEFGLRITCARDCAGPLLIPALVKACHTNELSGTAPFYHLYHGSSFYYLYHGSATLVKKSQNCPRRFAKSQSRV